MRLGHGSSGHGERLGPRCAASTIGAPRANVGARAALARDSAPMINSPAPRGTVDRRVTVPETEGRLLTASRLLSPHGTEMRARTPSRARSPRASSCAWRSQRDRHPIHQRQGELTRIVKIGLRVLTRIEFAKPPEVSGTWDNYLTSADILSEIREHHVARFEQSRRAAVSSVGRLPVLSYTLGD